MKHDTHAFINPLALKVMAFAIVCGITGVATVLQRHQISTTANRTKGLQARLVETERLINSTRADVERAQDPAMLKLLNAQWKLGLVPPAPQQTATLDAQPVPYLAAKHNRELFGSEAADPLHRADAADAPSPRRPAAAQVTPVTFNIVPARARAN